MRNKTKEQLELLQGKKYDVGILGNWCSSKCVNEITSYALETALGKLGYSALVIDRQDEPQLLNDSCDAFLLSSDQSWDYEIAKKFGKTFYLDFAADDKKKIAYAISFGREKSAVPMGEMPAVTKLLHRFDAVSAREEDAVEILKNEFGLEGPQVLDPALLLCRDEYEKLAESSQIKEEKFLLAYLMDSTPEIEEMLSFVSGKKGLKLIQISGLQEVSACDWIAYIKNASCVITDSVQGAGLALLFERPLVCLGNEERGMSGMVSLADLFALNHRLFTKPAKVKEKLRLLDKIDCSRIRKVLEMERVRSEKWLKEALEAPKVNLKNITCVTKKECCGCGACYNSCPVDAITMEYDDEGFLYPVINEEKCIHCGKCVKACPSLHAKRDNFKVPDMYAAYGDDKVRSVSSSGGIFSLVADYVLENGGAVCGAAFDEQQRLSHVVIYDEKDLPALRASKYIQSNTVKTYQEIKKVLDAGKMALYSGCPCQIAGLRTFLGKDYENLYTLDVLCHGGPSPVVFQKYLEEVHHGKKVVYVGFRDKDYYGWSTEMTVKYDNGEIYRKVRSEDLHYRSFLPCLSVRPHCQVCLYSALPRQGEFTLGDFWGVQKYDPKLTDGYGTSILSVNNEKGRKLLEIIKDKLVLLEPIDLKYILTHGQPFARPFKNNAMRYRFIRMIRDCSYERTIECCAANHFEYALYGMNADSYGDILGYYALYKSISRMNYSVLMVRRAKEDEKNVTPLKHRLTAFANRYYPKVSAVDRIGKMNTLNDTCRGLLAGPNQVWDEKRGPLFGFADKEKKKVFFEKEIGDILSPVFLLGREAYDELEKHGDMVLPVHYTAVYLKKDGAELAAKLEGAGKTVVLLDDDQMVENWISAIKHADCLITDSSDAVSMAAVYQVPLLTYCPDDETGKYLERLGLAGTAVTSAEALVKKAKGSTEVSWQEAQTALFGYRDKTLERLQKKLKYHKRPKDVLRAGKRRAVGFAKNTLPAPAKQAIKRVLGRA